MADAPSPNPRPEPSGEEKPTIPLAPVEPTAGKPSILKLIDDKCPNCGAHMESDAVVCMACGYDMKANEVLRSRTGVDEVEPEPTAADRPEFVKPGGKPMIFAIAGACILGGAMVASAMNAPRPDIGVRAAAAVLVLYHAVLHTGTGVIAVWLAARYVEEKLSNLELGAARIFLALSCFLVVASIRLPIENPFLENLARVPLAIAVYFLAIFILFRRSRQETVLFLLFHVGAAMFVELGVRLAVLLESIVAAKPGS
jgi:hypothetical protein